MTLLLGAVIAGGAARRFGSDKAAAMLGDVALIDHAIAALDRQCDAVVVCGRSWGALPALADRPVAGLGPLGGVAAALHYAAANGFDAVLTVPCDVPDLPNDLAARMGAGPALLKDCPVIGLWPAALSPTLDAYLAGDARRSMRAWGTAVGARAVAFDRSLANINRAEDLEGLRAGWRG